MLYKSCLSPVSKFIPLICSQQFPSLNILPKLLVVYEVITIQYILLIIIITTSFRLAVARWHVCPDSLSCDGFLCGCFLDLSFQCSFSMMTQVLREGITGQGIRREVGDGSRVYSRGGKWLQDPRNASINKQNCIHIQYRCLRKRRKLVQVWKLSTFFKYASGKQVLSILQTSWGQRCLDISAISIAYHDKRH